MSRVSRARLDSLNPDAGMLNAMDRRRMSSNRAKLDRCMRRADKGMMDEMMDGHCWSNGWGWLAMLLLWFIVVTIFAWLIFYSLRPSYVKNPDTGELDTSRLLLASVIVGVIFIVVAWLLLCLCNGSFLGGCCE